MRPFTFLRAQLSASGPPIITPINELIAIVIVAIGPATTIDICPVTRQTARGASSLSTIRVWSMTRRRRVSSRNAALPKSMPSEDFLRQGPG